MFKVLYAMGTRRLFALFPALFINTILFEKDLSDCHYFCNFTYPDSSASGKPEF